VICGIEDATNTCVAEVAGELAERYEVPVVYVHVLDGAGDKEQAARILRNTVRGTGELVVEDGQHPADRLIELAGRHDASFLVVGNHGPRSSLLGSISADVSRRAPCPVIVVSPAVRPSRAETASDESELEGGIVRLPVGSARRRIA
jgi:nucleotide-binding universal stress UspA family protein